MRKLRSPSGLWIPRSPADAAPGMDFFFAPVEVANPNRRPEFRHYSRRRIPAAGWFADDLPSADGHADAREVAELARCEENGLDRVKWLAPVHPHENRPARADLDQGPQIVGERSIRRCCRWQSRETRISAGTSPSEGQHRDNMRQDDERLPRPETWAGPLGAEGCRVLRSPISRAR